jgi:hypothetical protein
MMSRGIGQMQSVVLAALKPAKRAFAAGAFKYIGGADYENVFRHMTSDSHGGYQYPPEGPLVRAGGEFYTLGDGVYDLRATLVYLALQWPRRGMPRQNRDREDGYYWIDPSFRNAFTRAARTLIDRGLLIRCDGEDGPQVRLVSMRPDIDRQYTEDDNPLVLR